MNFICFECFSLFTLLLEMVLWMLLVHGINLVTVVILFPSYSECDLNISVFDTDFIAEHQNLSLALWKNQLRVIQSSW